MPQRVPARSRPGWEPSPARPPSRAGEGSLSCTGPSCTAPPLAPSHTTRIRLASATPCSQGGPGRGASVRVPWQVERDGKGYIEDRRPNADVDPYLVTRLMVDTCCSAPEKAGRV